MVPIPVTPRPPVIETLLLTSISAFTSRLLEKVEIPLILTPPLISVSPVKVEIPVTESPAPTTRELVIPTSAATSTLALRVENPITFKLLVVVIPEVTSIHLQVQYNLGMWKFLLQGDCQFVHSQD